MKRRAAHKLHRDMKKLCAALLAILLPAFLLGCLPAKHEQPDTGEREIFLTFDDGPTDSVTPLVLDVLKKEGVHATFFLIGRQIYGREAIVRRIAAEGHAIGIHSYSHAYATIYASPEALRQDIARCRAAIRTALPAFRGELYRYPGGSFGRSERLKDAVRREGLRAYDWNAATGDAEQPTPNAAAQLRNAVQSSRLRQRVILLQHDGVHQTRTAVCLPYIIAYFRKHGYRFKTLEED